MYILLIVLDLGANVQGRANRIPNGIDDTYRGMSFDAWLDIFMEFAICLAKRGKLAESYEMCQAAKDCVVFFHSRNDMFLLHLCWCSMWRDPNLMLSVYLLMCDQCAQSS
jgi:general transcription factor 3C polypeptide 3 (transcription factor C subunit 4)